jgi:hypothetical protein
MKNGTLQLKKTKTRNKKVIKLHPFLSMSIAIINDQPPIIKERIKRINAYF